MNLKNYIKENLLIIRISIIVLILIGIIGTYTYSFFTVTQTNSNIIAGTAETLSISVSVSKVAPSGNGKLIPQLDSAITSAITGVNGSCVDANNNTVCHTYKITAKNNGSTVTSLNGTVTINKKSNTNLKWVRYTPGTTPTLVGGVRLTTNVELTINDEFTAGQTKEYYIVVWISETGSGQTDTGTYSGVAEFKTAAANTTLVSLGLTPSLVAPDFSKTSCSSGCDEATVGIYSAPDDLGSSYYFRGDVTNNYVKFGKNNSGQDMYWRIIRINGDGTIRMIYMGTDITATSLTPVGTSMFNTNANDNTYAGYMYGDTGQTTYALTHSNKYDSAIKTFLEGTSANNYTDGWYYKNIVATGYSDYVADAIYCNDRSVASNSTGTGIGTTYTEYGANDRLLTNKTPTLKCIQVNDRFTTGTTVGQITGNGKLRYPVGLITVDEISLAGGKDGTVNSKYYLLGNNYWTMTPSFTTHMMATSNTCSLCHNIFNYSKGIIPVISLKSDAIKSGNGTKSYPFVLG